MRFRFFAAIVAALCLFSVPASAGNPLSVTIGTPGAGGGDPLFTAFAKINTAVNGIAQCFASNSSPTFSGSPLNYECWWNTTGAPTSIIYNFWDGVQWVPSGTLNATAHTFTAQGSATCTGDLTGTFPACTLLTSVNPNVGTFGSASVVPIITANSKGQVTAVTTAAIGSTSAGALTGTTLAAGVVNSSLTGVGTLTGGATGAGFTVALSTSTLTGTLPCARTPALIGDITTSAGSCTTVVAKIAGITVGTPTGSSGTGVVLAGSPTITTPLIIGDVTAATNQTAGDVGEIIQCSASGITLASGTAKTICSASVTAGHWMCTGGGDNTGAPTVTTYVGGISLTNNTLPTIVTNENGGGAVAVLGGAVPPVNFNFTSTTSVFFVEQSNFATAATGAAQMYCQRIW